MPELRTTPPSLDTVMRLGLGFWGAKALLSAVELGVFTVLAEGDLDATALAQRTGVHPRAARDFFDALVALRMLERTDGRYSNSVAAELFLDRTRPSYAGGLLEMANARLYALWGRLTESLQSGAPQAAAPGGDPFAALYADPAQLERFLGAMTGLTLGCATALSRQFDWSRVRTFADVGCAQGALPVQLALSHPHLAGVGFDLPPVQPVFERYVAARGLQQRVRFAAGDFFRDPLPHAEVLIMGHVLHDWGIDQKRLLLAKAHAALPAGGTLIVYETLIDDARSENAFALLASLNMLLETPAGFDFTGADCCDWMREAGFRETRVEPLVGPDSMVVAVK